MRFMIIVKNDPRSETIMPEPELFEAMGKFNRELVDAGILLAADGLSQSKDGALVTYKGGKHIVKDGPFTEAKELVAGFWIIQVKSREEAVAWVKKVPCNDGETVEVRRISEASDFEGVMPADAMAREGAMRAEIANKTS